VERRPRDDRQDHRQGLRRPRSSADRLWVDQIRGREPESVGNKVNFTGTDTLRVADGKLAEYWANADSLLFFQRLGIKQLQ
jgi:hypothetical protein